MLWAVTSYFNPCGYRNRLKTYRQFRERLSVPLITVELGFDGHFDLNESDAEHLIQVGDGDVMFQKERLLNIAIENLPPECTAVAWLDCDIYFENPRWSELALAKLETADVIQPFGTLYRLQQHDPIDFAAARNNVPPMISLVRQWQNAGVDPDYWSSTDGSKVNFRPGIAWAARRDVLSQIEIYDACIFGSGDKAFSCALLDIPKVNSNYLRMSTEYAEHYCAWKSRLSKLLPLQVDFVETELIQLWHGDYSDRRYRQRHIEAAKIGYDPARDIQRGVDGAWKWTDPDSELARFAKSYFASRREDG